MNSTDKRSYRNKVSNAQGHHFERLILAGCRHYAEQDIAVIDKTPEPFRVTQKHQQGRFTGIFTASAQPDFQGTLQGGRSIVFEAKFTLTDRMQRDALTETQLSTLLKHDKLGALAGVCICIQDKSFFVPVSVWANMKAIFGRKYVKPDELEQYRVRTDSIVKFLDYIHQSRKAD